MDKERDIREYNHIFHLIDRKNLVFTVKRQELDKLKTKCTDDFEVKYKFQLLS